MMTSAISVPPCHWMFVMFLLNVIQKMYPKVSFMGIRIIIFNAELKVISQGHKKSQLHIIVWRVELYNHHLK
jgi:hypothetical protein